MKGDACPMFQQFTGSHGLPFLTVCQNDKTPNKSLSLKISVPCRIILNVNRNFFENGHGNIKYSTENIASDIVITVCGVRWVTALLGGSLCEVYKCLITVALYT